jgi:ABC-type uncharacterized transport system substrate-binding protein
MRSSFLTFPATILLGALAVANCGSVSAHPHILITVRSEIVYAAEGQATAVRQSWTYDPAYSGFITRGFRSSGRSELAQDELAGLAKSQIDSFAEYEYFVTVKAKGLKLPLGAPRDYSLERKDGKRLVLSFTLPVNSAVGSDAELVMEIFDSNFFAYFTMADDESALHLVGAPAGCRASMNGPKPIDLSNTRSVPALFWKALDGSAVAGQQFVNRIVVACP